VANQILFVPTAQAGLALVANALLEPGDHAWVESPGYGGANVAFQAAGAIVSAIPLDSQGMVISSHKETPRRSSSPVAPVPDRAADADRPPPRTSSLCRAAGACIIEDDYDGVPLRHARWPRCGLAPSRAYSISAPSRSDLRRYSHWLCRRAGSADRRF
jgi:GntR family transcriptional regulator/MocR family aminotransferase